MSYQQPTVGDTVFYRLAIMVLVGIVLIVFSYHFIDRPVAWFMFDHHTHRFVIFKFFANEITKFIGVCVVIFYCYYGIQLLRHRISDIARRLVLLCHAIVIGQAIKEALKGIFGRYWPATWTGHNPSLLHDHAYGFHWLHSGAAYGSFPSGHATFIFSFAATWWFVFPRFRWLAGIICLLVAVSQVIMYYHFVSDILGGAMLGTLVGYCVAHHDRFVRSPYPDS